VHEGKTNPWPKFIDFGSKEQKTEVVDEKEIFKRELICFHSKEGYQFNQIGLGLKVSRVPRTGQVSNANLSLDYISLRSFLKEGIRWSSINEQFTNWIPIYLPGEDVTIERELN
jgi:hypothetical protein